MGRKKTLEQVSETTRWLKVEAAKAWKPKKPGEVLEGTYGGEVVKEGARGHYSRFVIHGYTKTFYVTGVSVTELFNVADLEIGDRIRVVYISTKTSLNGFEYREFELYKEVS